MPSIRIGFTTDFNLRSRQVGIGTTLPTSRLDVRGQILSDNSAGGGGVSTITRYDGFLNKIQGIGNTVSIAQTTKGNLNSLSGEIVIPSGREVAITTNTQVAGRIESLTVTSLFDLPHGGIADREETPEKGTTRFNDDLGTIEFYTGVEWRPVGAYDGSGRGRGVFGGGATPTQLQVIDYVNISSLGNAQDFGILLNAKSRSGACSSSIRGLFGGGEFLPAVTNSIEYITIASQGNGISFGSLTEARSTLASFSSSTRGVFGSGRNPANTNVIDYVQIGTLGNALDFGDVIRGRQWVAGSSSSTRGIFAGGELTTRVTAIEAVNISSIGNSVYFGDLTQERGNTSTGITNGTRAVFAGGEGTVTAQLNTIDYITISTFGNAIDFGDLTIPRAVVTGGVSSFTRGLIAGGTTPTNSNTIDYITIASIGNAMDFGDLTIARFATGGVSDSHGGLGGF